MGDDEILQLFYHRVEYAISAVEEKYGRLCRSVARGILKDERDVEECVNDTCMRAWNAIPPEKPRSLEAYLVRITRNLALDRYAYHHSQKRETALTEAPAEIAGAIRYANRWELADLIITGRGGGSMEDLWAFNDERVARAIADSHIPVISAVGHEPDVTISDFVADLRAATPSNAAELAVPDQTELRQHLAAQRAMLLTLMTRRLKQERQRVAQLAGARALRDPKNYIDDRRMQLDYTQRRLIAALQRLVAQQRERFVRLTSKLDAMSPLKVLSRGYSMTFDAQGHVVRSVRTLSCGDRITVRLADGRASAEVREIQEDAT